MAGQGTMAQRGDRRAQAKAWAAEIAAARRRAGLVFPDALSAAAQRWSGRLADWVASDVAPGRLTPWLAVAFGFGIVVYFTADREPVWWVALGAAIAAGVVAVIARRRPVGFPVALALAAMLGGFSTGAIKTALIDHPVLATPVFGAKITGFVETREEREKSDRIVIRVDHIEAPRLRVAPERVRLAVRKGTAPAVGEFVELKARLSPPLSPLRPGGYDFARDMYFLRIGASGYALGAIKRVPAPAPEMMLRFAAAIDGMRETINKRIRAVISGDEGSIASALLTGKRGAISEPVSDAFYVSSLAHVLAISGYHMAVVSGIVFFFIRAMLALIPSMASRRPIKKYAAAGALVAAAFYLVLSGASVSTQRAFVMVAIVLTGVMLDRQALTFRTITVAAFAVLILAPQAVAQPSFQMSFAATLALIAGYRFGLPWLHATADTPRSARIALWGGREVAGLIFASLLAGLATTPYAAFHFHRLAPYGVLANLLAMPVVSAWVMPMGILAIIALPFGFDAPFWSLMAHGIDWMITVVLWVAHLPGAVGRIAAFDTGPLLLGTAALLLICLLRTPLRWSGAVLAVVASVWAVATPRPDVLIAADGLSAAVRGADGRLAMLSSGRDTFAVKEWLAADGDGRTVKDVSLRDGVRCDPSGCNAKLKDGRLVAMSLAVDAFDDDCARAAVVISPRSAPGECQPRLIDRDVWRDNGAIALRRGGEGFDLHASRPASEDRPWSHVVRHIEAAQTPVRPAPRDATPKAQDIEPDD
jgi:competence protein ComEC